jgi:adenylate cyclase
MERRLTAILAADVVGYSRLMGADYTDTFNRLKEVKMSSSAPTSLVIRDGA